MPNAVIAYEAEHPIRDIIGHHVLLKNIFTEKRIGECQALIDKTRDRFFDVVQKDLDGLSALLGKPNQIGHANIIVLEDIAALSHNIKKLADFFDYEFVSALAGHIVARCKEGNLPTTKRRRLIEDLVDMLHVAVKQDIRDESHQFVKELGLIFGKTDAPPPANPL